MTPTYSLLYMGRFWYSDRNLLSITSSLQEVQHPSRLHNTTYAVITEIAIEMRHAASVSLDAPAAENSIEYCELEGIGGVCGIVEL